MNNAIRFQDATITEYADGTEEVRFTDAEWAIMRNDPAFGYVRRCGHPTTIYNGVLIDNDCPICEAGPEYD
jgi:hypothetical protein